MAVSKCVYPYPVLIIADVKELRRYVSEFRDESWTVDRGEIRLSFYQIEGKPWDWSRARRLADGCYASHGAISIEDPLGNVWLDGEQPAEHAPRPRAVPRSVLIEVINGYLAGKYGRAELAQVAA
jgi:hypothetical protein